MKRCMAWTLAGVLLAAWAAAAPAAEGPAPRVLIIVAENFNRGEFWTPYLVLKAAGYQVDVAAPKKGPVSSGGKTPEQDAPAGLALDEVDASKYIGLVIPGGFSPGNLEKIPRSLEICRAFMQADKPVSAICHGPRLLMRAGLMKDRVGTCLYKVADELADAWAAGEYGKYLDLPVVVDRNLVTSRYPGDLDPFCRATLDRLEKAGGLPVPRKAAQAVVVALGIGGHEKWSLTEIPGILDVKVTFLGSENDLRKLVGAEGFDAAPYDLLLLGDTGEADKLRQSADFKDLVARFQKAGRTVAATNEAESVLRNLGLEGLAFKTIAGDIDVIRRELVALAQQQAAAAGRGAAAEPPPAPDLAKLLDEIAKAPPLASDKAEAYTAAIALREGFDDLVAMALHAYLKKQGRAVLVVGPKKGELRGLNGVRAVVEAAYGDAVSLAADAIIVAPGGVWPEKAEARQATQPAWIEEQEERDRQRLAWLQERWKAGATLAVFGLDSLRLGGGNAAFAGKKFASSPQTVWSFGKGGGSHSGEAALVTDERLITCRGADAIAEAIGLLEARGK